MKILIDVPVHDEVLGCACKYSGRHEIDCLDTAQRHRAGGRSGFSKDAEVLFCSTPPRELCGHGGGEMGADRLG